MSTASGNISISKGVSAGLTVVECRGIGPCVIEANGSFGPVSIAWTHGSVAPVFPVLSATSSLVYTTAASTRLDFPEGLPRIVRATVGSATAATDVTVSILFGKGEIGV